MSKLRLKNKLLEASNEFIYDIDTKKLFNRKVTVARVLDLAKKALKKAQQNEHDDLVKSLEIEIQSLETLLNNADNFDLISDEPIENKEEQSEFDSEDNLDSELEDDSEDVEIDNEENDDEENNRDEQKSDDEDDSNDTELQNSDHIDDNQADEDDFSKSDIDNQNSNKNLDQNEHEFNNDENNSSSGNGSEDDSEDNSEDDSEFEDTEDDSEEYDKSEDEEDTNSEDEEDEEYEEDNSEEVSDEEDNEDSEDDSDNSSIESNDTDEDEKNQDEEDLDNISDVKDDSEDNSEDDEDSHLNNEEDDEDEEDENPFEDTSEEENSSEDDDSTASKNSNSTDDENSTGDEDDIDDPENQQNSSNSNNENADDEEDTNSEAAVDDDTILIDPFANSGEEIPQDLQQQIDDGRLKIEKELAAVKRILTPLKGEARRGAKEAILSILKNQGVDINNIKFEESFDHKSVLHEATNKHLAQLTDDEFEREINKIMDLIDQEEDVDYSVDLDTRIKEIKKDVKNSAKSRELDIEDQKNLMKDPDYVKAREAENAKYKKFRNLEAFKINFFRAIKDQVDEIEDMEDTWSAIDRRHEDDPSIIKQGKVISDYEDETIPTIDVYFDQSASWGDDEILVGNSALSVINEYVENGDVKLNIYYFADNVHNTPAPARAEITTYGWNKILQNIKNSGAKNVIIMSDSDIESMGGGAAKSERVAVDGCVWYIWKNGDCSNSAPSKLFGRLGTYEYSFKA